MSALSPNETLCSHVDRRPLSDSADVTGAAFAVGYESRSQFGREYSCLFRFSPSRDTARMRQARPLSEELAVWSEADECRLVLDQDQGSSRREMGQIECL